MRRAAHLRRRLDALQARLEPDGESARVSASASSSLEAAVERLERSLDAFEARQEAAGAVADRLVGALDVIPQGIILADGSGRIVFRNRVAQGFTAARHAEALVERAIEELVAHALAGAADTRVLELYGPPRRAVQVRAVPLEDPEAGAVAPGAAGAFLLVEDVSERQRLDAVRKDFVANISHELKTPVGALGLLAETLAVEEDPAVVHRLAAKMQREAFRVSDTIDDLLQLSQIEAGEPPLREPVSVDLVVAEAVDRTQPAAELRDVRLVVDVPGPGLCVVGDRRQLVSAVSNLCDNGVKYSDPGSAVTVTARAVGDRVAIEVADQGIGIPAADLSRVFERFYRVDRARSRDTGGTGLGLAIVRHVVNNHEGEVHVDSREGEGSTFTLSLPAA